MSWNIFKRREVKPWPCQQCPVCDSRLQRLKCVNGCYQFALMQQSVYIFDERFYLGRNFKWQNRRTYFKVQKKIKYWQKDERYLIHILANN